MENRNGLVVNATLTIASGTAEREAALALIEQRPQKTRMTLGADKAYGNSLVQAISYNNRLQANEIKLGTSGAPTSILDLAYNYGTTNNNGNVQSLTYAGGGLSYTQTFVSHSLNHLPTSLQNSGPSCYHPM